MLFWSGNSTCWARVDQHVEFSKWKLINSWSTFAFRGCGWRMRNVDQLLINFHAENKHNMLYNSWSICWLFDEKLINCWWECWFLWPNQQLINCWTTSFNSTLLNNSWSTCWISVKCCPTVDQQCYFWEVKLINCWSTCWFWSWFMLINCWSTLWPVMADVDQQLINMFNSESTCWSTVDQLLQGWGLSGPLFRNWSKRDMEATLLQ